MRVVSVVVLVGLMVWMNGCALGQMETAHQLDSGDVSVSGTLAWPGMLYIPKASVNAMYGIGGVADISAHAGTTIATGNVGLGARLYPNEWLTLSVQGDVMASMDELSDVVLVTVTPRLTTAATSENFLYGGIQSHITVNGFNGFDGLNWDGNGDNFVLGGILGGIDYWFADSGLGAQMEGIVNPLSYSDGQFGLFEDEGILFAFQVSVGVYYRTPELPQIEQTVEPTREENVRDVTPRRVPEPNEEREEEPEFDDDGVPLY